MKINIQYKKETISINKDFLPYKLYEKINVNEIIINDNFFSLKSFLRLSPTTTKSNFY